MSDKEFNVSKAEIYEAIEELEATDDLEDTEDAEPCEDSEPYDDSEAYEESEGTEDREPATEVMPKAAKDPSKSVIAALFDYVEILVFSLCAVLIIFSAFARLCRVSGDSMNTTLTNGETLITTNFNYTPEQGDIIVFHMTSDTYVRFNEPIVKRVIATEGQTVMIDYKTGIITVDGVQFEDETAYLDSRYYNPIYYRDYIDGFDIKTGVFEVTVPEGHLFVLGDNRNNSSDSRFNAVGFVDERRVLGKVVMRLSPFTLY